MATLILTTVGSVIGGPLGGAIGSLIGNQIDRSIFSPAGREGPRLKELAVTSSSYGTPIPRYFGTMRAAGSVIWATDLVEESETTGGGKSGPSTTTFSYSGNFAVALASRPITSLGRIWADGRLLRGAAGDLKVGGALRIYNGFGDQAPDPLLESAEGPLCPAFRGLAYCVFEGLQLAEFGNRIPTLAFEITSDIGEVSLFEMLAPLDGEEIAIARDLPGLEGFADEGGPLLSTLELLDQVYPFSCDTGGGQLALRATDPEVATALVVPEPVVDQASESFGKAYGRSGERSTNAAQLPSALRYYDLSRDFQPGLQHATGRRLPGRNVVIDFPGALQAGTARRLIDDLTARRAISGDRLQWRIAELDDRIGPGALVSVAGRAGKWRVESWEWRESGIELELTRVVSTAPTQIPTDSGRNLAAPDEVATPTLLLASEVPWDGLGSRHERRVLVAASSASGGWTGAMLYADHGASLAPIRGTGGQRAVIGTLASALPAADPAIMDRASRVEITLASPDFMLTARSPEALAEGANQMLVGSELIQFAEAEDLGAGNWRLSGLLRGRAGTEAAALAGTPAGADAILLDGKVISLGASDLGTAEGVAAIGLADPTPAQAAIANIGLTLRPLSPVHPRVAAGASGVELCWTRRARGAWTWPGTVEPPLAEELERYEVGLGDPASPVLAWELGEPRLAFSPAEWSALLTGHAGMALWVRQIGDHDRSDPLFLTTLA